MMLAKVAPAEEGGNKARWISEFFAFLPRYPEIRAFVWFDYDKEADLAYRQLSRRALRSLPESPRGGIGERTKAAEAEPGWASF
jgi:hypothetical protein